MSILCYAKEPSTLLAVGKCITVLSTLPGCGGMNGVCDTGSKLPWKGEVFD